MKLLKRLVVWSLEALAEALLLGTLFGVLLFPDFISMLRGGILASALWLALNCSSMVTT